MWKSAAPSTAARKLVFIVGIAVLIGATIFSWTVGFRPRPLFHEGRERLDRRFWPQWVLTGLVEDQQNRGYVDRRLNIVLLVIDGNGNVNRYSDKFYSDHVCVSVSTDTIPLTINTGAIPSPINICKNRNQVVVCMPGPRAIQVPVESGFSNRFVKALIRSGYMSDLTDALRTVMDPDEFEIIERFLKQKSAPKESLR